jgi:hypothetical protein
MAFGGHFARTEKDRAQTNLIQPQEKAVKQK